ncbi:helix-turn-helix transcriptional regulator [Paucihalobacter ruber]|uniref:Helix-turn-helix transcriptional regulator n=1 Tax=Paucihalobacter ruber TaxID=2567861 RepID=A0A506PAT6_9FLAO|nr:helix-turn-helix transcriptional regulator [Paucihalobacter ruber]TPV31046.1 helix-turn-helix transcriptional regulator [Paucihalobacter ruber]
MQSFGKKLREQREVKKISQNKLAKLIEAHHSAIGKYERDEVRPSIDVVVKIADVLDTTVGYLLGETNDADAFQDPIMLKRLNDINELPQKERDALLLTIDAFLRDFKTKKAYA